MFLATSTVTADAAEYFRLPRERTVILGSRIEVELGSVPAHAECARAARKQPLPGCAIFGGAVSLQIDTPWCPVLVGPILGQTWPYWAKRAGSTRSLRCRIYWYLQDFLAQRR